MDLSEYPFEESLKTKLSNLKSLNFVRYNEEEEWEKAHRLLNSQKDSEANISRQRSQVRAR